MVEFEQAMKKLRSVNGYLGSAVLNFSGETLYMDEENTSVDIAYSASIFNDAFRMISESSLDVGFADASLVEARTDMDMFSLSTVREVEPVTTSPNLQHLLSLEMTEM